MQKSDDPLAVQLPQKPDRSVGNKTDEETNEETTFSNVIGRLGDLSGIGLGDFSGYIRMFAFYQVAILLIALGLIGFLFFSPLGEKVKEKYL